MNNEDMKAFEAWWNAYEVDSIETEETDAAAAYAAGLERGRGKWRDIDTDPPAKTVGRHIMTWCPCHKYGIYSMGGLAYDNITHWRELPAPPREEET